MGLKASGGGRGGKVRKSDIAQALVQWVCYDLHDNLGNVELIIIAASYPAKEVWQAGYQGRDA